MQRFIVIVFIQLASIGGVFAQQVMTDIHYYVMDCVNFLASDSLAGRQAGSVYETKAADWVANQFKKAKIKPLVKKDYFQEFSWTYDSVEYNSKNVIGFINNKADKTIVIGAHYDHLGYGGKRSRSFGKSDVHNGADDNASGVAAMLFIACEIKAYGNKNFNYIFIGFAAHEPGLFGSNYFLNSSICKSQNICLFVNFDMVGRLSLTEPLLFYSTSNFNPAFESSSQNVYKIDFKKIDLHKGDHSPFVDAEIPVLLITTGIHDDYHKISDDADKINFLGIVEICGVVIDVFDLMR